MRKITKNPNRVIPNIIERDRYENLVIVHLWSYRDERIAFIINNDIYSINWCGSDNLKMRPDCGICFEWNWYSNNNLLEQLLRSWRDWEQNGFKIIIYIAESKKDVKDALSSILTVNKNLYSEIVKKFPERRNN